MENRKLKLPLSIYVLYDTACEDAAKLYEHIYNLLCRDSSRPLSEGLDIPIYVRTKINNTIKKIHYEQQEITIVIVLIDIFMYGDMDWTRYVKHLYDRSLSPSTDSKLYVLPVALCDYATDFAGLQKLNAIKYKDNDIFNHIEDFNIRLYDSLLSFLKGKDNERLQIFISHAKKDGVEKAEELRAYIAKNTKLTFFYDANSIKDGRDFEETIERSARDSLLVVLNTDAYSGRDWCQREIIIAKEKFCPIILVDLINNYVDRAFPYLGNIPWVAYKGDWQTVLTILLRTALNYVYQRKFLEYIANNRGYKNCAKIPFTPELFTVLATNEKNILYPEPVLGYSERNIMYARFTDKNFSTPAQYNILAPSFLSGKRIAISVSESDNSLEKGVSLLMLKDFIVELARYILVNDGHLVYGGNLQKEGFTKLFANLSKQYKDTRLLQVNKYFFTNYFAWPLNLLITDKEKADFIFSRTEIIFVEPKLEKTIDFKKYLKPENNENKFVWAKSFSEMREKKEKNTDVLILVGGKINNFKGCMPGILEEFITAIRQNHNVYLLGGYGGMAEIIVKVINGEISHKDFINCILDDVEYKKFHEYYNLHNDKHINYDDIYDEIQESSFLVNRGLSEEEKTKLFSTSNIIESIELIFKGIANLYV